MPQLRFVASPDAEWLYDCHTQRFAGVEHGACMATGFAPLFISQRFGIQVRDWPRRMREVQLALDTATPEEADRIIRDHPPTRSGVMAAEMALMAYPSAARFVERTDGDHAPFQLRDEMLHQPNVPLAFLERRDAERWKRDAKVDLRLPDHRLRVAESLRLPSPGVSQGDPGCYVLGHSTLLVRGRASGILIDPIPSAPVTSGTGYDAAWMLRHADAVALTHGHFDHYHLPSLLEFGGLPLVVPHVPRASAVCEDLGTRLRDFGLAPVEASEWQTPLSLPGLTVHALPFIGEQFLTSEEHPDARNWGCCYLVETEDLRVLVIADAGFESGRSIFDAISRMVAESGPVDLVAAQCIGLRTALGQGDADLQIAALACAHRADEAFSLLRPERRVTLSVDDTPRLMDVSGARALVLCGQFSFEPGAEAVAEPLRDAVDAALCAAGHVDAAPMLRVGEGLGPGGRRVTLRLFD